MVTLLLGYVLGERGVGRYRLGGCPTEQTGSFAYRAISRITNRPRTASRMRVRFVRTPLGNMTLPECIAADSLNSGCVVRGIGVHYQLYSGKEHSFARATMHMSKR